MDDKEHTRQTPKAIVVSTYPDVCRSPTAPVPYQIVSIFKDSSGLAQSVRATDQSTFTEASQINGVIGDEGGTGKGVKSGTHAKEGISTPIDWSNTVRAEGKRVVRHDDPFEMNTKNTQGKVVFPDKDGGKNGEVDKNGRPTKDTNPKDKGFWERTKDWAGEKAQWAKDQYNYLDQNYQIGTRAGGVLTAAGGVGEMGFGGGLALAPEPTMVSKVVGGVMVVHGADRFNAGFQQAWTGVPQQTATEQMTSGLARSMGASDRLADSIGKGVDGGLAGPAQAQGIYDKAKKLKDLLTGTRVSGPAKKVPQAPKSGDTAPRRQYDDTD